MCVCVYSHTSVCVRDCLIVACIYMYITCVVCIYLDMCIYIHILAHTGCRRGYVHTYVNIHIYIYTHTFTCTIPYIFTYTRHTQVEDVEGVIQIHMSCTYILTHTDMYMIHIHIYIYIDTHRLKTWRAWMCTQTKQTNEQVMQGVPLDKIGGVCVGCRCCSVLQRGAVSLRVLQGVPLDKIEVCVLQCVCSV